MITKTFSCAARYLSTTEISKTGKGRQEDRVAPYPSPRVALYLLRRRKPIFSSVRKANKGTVIAWNEVCAEEKDLYGHVRRDADQRDEESCKHGKVILILILSNLDSKPRANTSHFLPSNG